MGAFFSQYGVQILCFLLGAFFIGVSYAAMRAQRSGVWFIGGILILIGGLLSPCKWPALLALADQGFWFPFYMLRDYLNCKAVAKRFESYYRENGITPDPEAEISYDKNLKVRIDERDEELVWNYRNSSVYHLRIPRINFVIAKDDDGNERLIVERCDGKERKVEVKPFGHDGASISNIRYKKGIFNVRLSAVTVLQR